MHACARINRDTRAVSQPAPQPPQPPRVVAILAQVRFACLVLLSARAVPGKFDAKGFGSAADLGVRLCHSSLVVAVDGLVLEDFVSAGVHCGVLVLVYWSVAVGAWLACLAHHDFVGCGIFHYDRCRWLARSRAMLLDCEMLGLWLDPQFLSVVLPNMFSVSCACCDAGLRRCVVFPEAKWSDISRSWVLLHCRLPVRHYRDWASGRVDVPGSVNDEIYDMRQRPDASSAAVSNESSSTPDRIQAMIISLSGKTLMIDANPDAPVLLLLEDVAKVFGLPETCFYLTVGSRVLRDCMSLAAEGVGSGC